MHRPQFLLGIVLLLAGCASPPAPPNPAAPTVAPAPAFSQGQDQSGLAIPTAAAMPPSVTDDANRKVTLTHLPDRIISISPAATEIAFALGLGPEVVAVDEYSDYPPAAKQKPGLGSYLHPDMEALVAARPDLVLATDVHEKDLVPALDRLHIPVAVLSPTTWQGVLGDISLVGLLTGTSVQADQLNRQLEARMASVESAVKNAPHPRVFFELSADLYSAGPGTFINDLIQRAGGDNIASASQTPWPKLSPEAVLSSDPDVIILAHDDAGGSPQAVAGRPGWSRVSAVRTGRVYAIDRNLTNRPGPRLVQGLEVLARDIHPELFPPDSHER